MSAQTIHAQSAITKFQRSSVVERSAVNRLVVGSNPTAGARCNLLSLYPQESGRAAGSTLTIKIIWANTLAGAIGLRFRGASLVKDYLLTSYRSQFIISCKNRVGCQRQTLQINCG
jgi:hypothetical protein